MANRFVFCSKYVTVRCEWWSWEDYPTSKNIHNYACNNLRIAEISSTNCVKLTVFKVQYEIFSLYSSSAVTRTLSSHECVLYIASRSCQNIYPHIPIQIFSICFELFNVMKRSSSYEYSGVIDYTWHNHNWHLQNQITAKKCVFKTTIQYNFA